MDGHWKKPRRDTAVHREVCGVQDKSKTKDRNRGRLALRNKVKEEKHLEVYGGVKIKNRNENVFAGPNGLRKNAETAISCRGPGPAIKKKEAYQYSRGGVRRCTYVPLWQSKRE